MAARQFGAKREARRAFRRQVDLECEVYSDVWGEPLPHQATEVSEDGLWIRTELPLEVGSEVTLTFYPPDWEEPLCVAGRVRRVQLRPRSEWGGTVGMGIAFESLRNDERRRLTRSMRCLRARDSYILDQRTLTGVPVGVGESEEPVPASERTIVGWAAPRLPPEGGGRESRITASPPERGGLGEPLKGAFTGGLDLAASVFASDSGD